MEVDQIKRTIVRNATQLAAYPFSCLAQSVHDRLDAAIDEVGVDRSKFGTASLFKLLECYLAISGRKLSLPDLSRSSTRALLEGFLGALASPNFVAFSAITVEAYQNTFLKILRETKKTLPLNVPQAGDKGTWDTIWQQTELKSEAVAFWSGWWVHGKQSEDLFLDLVYLRLAYGPVITSMTFDALANYWQGLEQKSTNNSKPLFVQFFRFLSEKCSERNTFSSGVHLSRDIFAFCDHFFTRAHKAHLSLDTSVKRWNDWRVVVKKALIETQVWPCPTPPIPAPGRRDTPGSLTRLKLTPQGVEVREKLLTDVPLELTDDEAIEVLFGEVISDVEAVVAWAHEQATHLYLKSSQRRQLALGGIVIEAGNTNLSIQEIGVENVAAAFEKFGFEIFQRENYRKFVGVGTAREIEQALGIPGAFDLEPFMYLLINEHQQITDAFLRGLVLYDKHGHQVGFEKTDSGYALIGTKRRRGPNRAEQRIELSESAAAVVSQVLDITAALRKWLRASGSDDWRYLFLSTAKGLRKPSRVLLRSPDRGASAAVRLEQLSKHTSKQGNKLRTFMRRLTLTSFRASRALRVYLETKDVEEMSRALGHAKYRTGLLSHYLPEPILRFFTSRWIRIFQTSMVCESMRDSSLLGRAAGFTTAKEMHAFLEKHAFKGLPSNLSQDEQPFVDASNPARAYINAGVGVLTVLVSLQEAVAAEKGPINGYARYWSTFADKVVAEISRADHDVVLGDNLRRARESANPEPYRRLVRE